MAEKSDKIFYDADNKWSHWVVKKYQSKIPVLIENLKLFNIEKLKCQAHNLKMQYGGMVAKILKLKK